MPIDKDKLYETFQKSLERHQKLTDLATRKALDLPIDEGSGITTINGVSGKVLLGLGLGGTSIVAAAMIAIAYLLSGSTVPQQSAQPAEVQYKVEHFDQNGEPIYVPPADKEP